ncbi:MAG: hypothetical protein ACP5NZ_02345 [Nanobdellota archaeon]
MPRKAKLKTEEENKAKEIKELKTKLSQEEINSLEQMIEDNDNVVNSAELREFLSGQDIERTSSPSLKKINAPQKSPIMLERDIITGAMSAPNLNNNGENGENNGFKYLPEVQNQNSPKYVQYGERVGEMNKIRDFERPKIESPFERREMIMNGSMKTTPDIESFEKYTTSFSTARKSEKDKMLKRDPFERKEIKYTPEKY